jgi:hypothetical protein
VQVVRGLRDCPSAAPYSGSPGARQVGSPGSDGRSHPTRTCSTPRFGPTNGTACEYRAWGRRTVGLALVGAWREPPAPITPVHAPFVTLKRRPLSDQAADLADVAGVSSPSTSSGTGGPAANRLRFFVHWSRHAPRTRGRVPSATSLELSYPPLAGWRERRRIDVGVLLG